MPAINSLFFTETAQLIAGYGLNKVVKRNPGYFHGSKEDGLWRLP
jgi:hypothetical protein